MPLLHHYTDLHGLAGIVQTQSFWCNEFRSMNDKSEIRYAFDIITMTAFQRMMEALPVDVRGKFIGPKQVEEMSKLVIEGIVEQVVKSDGYGSFFSTSFARANHPTDDDTGLLTLWDRYTQLGGYCIQFDSARVRDAVQREAERYSYEYLDLVEVKYGVDLDGHDFQHLVSNFVLHIKLDVAKRLARYDFVSENDVPIPMSSFANQLFRFCSTHKDPFFRDEREVRIIACPHGKAIPAPFAGLKLPKKIYDRGIQDRPVRYFTIFNEVLPGLRPKRILVGPKVDQIERMALLDLWPRPPVILQPTFPIR